MCRATGAQCAAQADLADPFEHRHERDVGDAERAHQQRHAAEEQEQGVQVVLHVAAQLRGLRRCGTRNSAGIARV